VEIRKKREDTREKREKLKKGGTVIGGDNRETANRGKEKRGALRRSLRE